MNVVMSFCGLCFLLIIGKALRSFIPLFQRLYLPSSVIGGLAGLLIIQLCGDRLPAGWTAGWGQVPGFLINVVFAALFLGVVTPKFKEMWGVAAPQFCFGQLMAWGQYVIGLGIVGLLLAPAFGVPDAFGNLLEAGFEGGHGTVAGLSSTFRDKGWEVGIHLGYTVATVGMILGIVIGMILVNWAARRGHIRFIRSFADQEPSERRGIYSREDQPPAGEQTVHSDSIDSLAWHIALIGLAILVGFGIQQLLAALNPHAPGWLREINVLASFPLFPLCMIGGLLVQKLAQTIRVDSMISHGQMQRLSGAALDFLVVTAIASIRIEVVWSYWLPLTVLMALGTVWSVVMVLFVGPRIFRDAWFERSIADFGQSMGVTATGLLLLRTVDPESRTVASQAFGYKQLLHEPIMGGGFWTSIALGWVFAAGWLPVWLVSAVFFVLWLGVAWYFAVKKKRQSTAG